MRQNFENFTIILGFLKINWHETEKHFKFWVFPELFYLTH